VCPVYKCRLQTATCETARANPVWTLRVGRGVNYSTNRNITHFSKEARSAAARLLRLWVQIQPGAWMSVCYECCVLSGRGLCEGLITRPEESYRLWCVVVCDLETSWMRRPWPTGGEVAPKTKEARLH